MDFSKIFANCFLYIVLLPAAVFAKDLGTVGAVYDIKEMDALSEIEERAKGVNWEEKINKAEFQKKISNFKPKDIISLQKASASKKFSVDMTYTLTFDIPDGKGGILYPKGYIFNPLDYVTLPTTLVVIDGTDKDQIKWFKSSKYFSDFNVMLLLSDGSYSEISTEFKRPVYYSTKEITTKFKLKAVPSIIKQNGKLMEVEEIALNTTKTKE